MFCYETESVMVRVTRKGGASIAGIDPHPHFMTHFRNSLFLKFMMGNPKATVAEKAQARREMDICERKMNFWKRHPLFSMQTALPRMEQAKKEWKQ